MTALPPHKSRTAEIVRRKRTLEVIEAFLLRIDQDMPVGATIGGRNVPLTAEGQNSIARAVREDLDRQRQALGA